ncbi:MAG TPA: DUF1614 domain-containing protein [Gammaproteobacteria bacterium]|nr:DUF1614 domain-containing protein [Gammaproteobacteria bacterium]
MRPPLSAFYLLLLIFILGFLLTFIQIGIFTIAFDKLGLSPHSALLLLVSSLFGSLINLPLFTIKAEPAPPDLTPSPWRGLLQQPLREFHGKTLIAVNVGGCIIPVAFTLYLLQYHDLPALQLVTAIIIVSTVCYHFSRPIPGMGIGMPIFVAPITAALTALIISPEHSAPLAYISGTLGVLIGADVMRLKDIRTMGVPVASFGGAGTFDGIFLTGIIAALLA